MNEVINIVIPGIPIAKERARSGIIGYGARKGDKCFYTPPKTYNYENLIKILSFQEMKGRKPFDEAVYVEMKVYLPIPESWSAKIKKKALDGEMMPSKKPDLDNYIKSVLDGMNKVVFTDDSLIVKITAQKAYSNKPRVEIKVGIIQVE